MGDWGAGDTVRAVLDDAIWRAGVDAGCIAAAMEPGKTDQTIADRKASGTPSQAAAATASVEKGKKKGEQEYTGPTTVVELPPTPMLDEEGKQRQDPDGKLMFNPPVKQQRDKKGHPLFDAEGKPVRQTKDNLGYDENGKKLHP